MGHVNGTNSCQPHGRGDSARGTWRPILLLVVSGTIAILAGCKDLAGSSTVPSGTLDPSIYNTPGWVQQEYAGVRTLFGIALNQMILGSGTFTDELTNGSTLDKRQLSQRIDRSDAFDGGLAYTKLQDVRVQADLTARVINAFSVDVPAVVRGELYALQGYAEILLADLYCSGVPLTTLDVRGTIRYEPGSSRDSVYAHAIRLFDSALALSVDSARIMTLARVGKGRALLALGQYDAAAAAVAAVATTDQYTTTLVLGIPERLDGFVAPNDFGTYSVSDREGGTGLAYRSDNDPRTGATPFTDASGMITYYAPTKYYQGGNVGDSTKVIVASGVEARLIEAESELHAGQAAQSLATLNALRTNGQKVDSVLDIQYRLDGNGNLIFDPNIGDFLQDTTVLSVDTSWSAGGGGVSGLPLLSDPMTAQARVDTLFSERAKWLFLTGHRQGDLRRLLRQYPGHSPNTVYPSGRFTDGDSYGDAVTVPIPATERVNPQFDGCFDRLP